MSTHALIAAFIDGKIHAIYCHSDGYLDGIGQGLVIFYNDLEKIKKLIALGNLSTFGSRPNSCDAYHRDRGMTWDKNKPMVLDSCYELLNVNKDQDITYYFNGECWLYMKLCQNHIFSDLEKDLKIAGLLK